MSKFTETPISHDDRRRWQEQGLDAMSAAFPRAPIDDETAIDTIMAVLHAVHTTRHYGYEGIAEILSCVQANGRAERILREE